MTEAYPQIDEAGAPAMLHTLLVRLEAFNASSDSNLSDHQVITGLATNARMREMTGQGICVEEAAIIADAVAHPMSDEEGAAHLGYEFIGAEYGDTLGAFGLSLSTEPLGDRYLVITEPTKLADQLRGISIDDMTPEIQRGLAAMIKGFVGPLPGHVMDNNETETKALGWWPVFMEEARPDPEQYAITIQTLQNGHRVAAECERLGVAPIFVERLRQATRYYEAGAIVEWASAVELGFLRDPSDGDGIIVQHRYWHSAKQWEPLGRILGALEAKIGLTAPSVAEFKESVVAALDSFIRALMADKLILSAEQDAELWPDPAVALAQAAERVQANPLLADLLAIRQGLVA